MPSITSLLTIIHVVAGFSSLLLFWIPAFNRKGGVNHIRIGNLYVKLMWIVVITSGLLSIKNLYIGRTQMAAFLGFLTILTANPLWKGIAILNYKKGLTDAFLKRQLFLEIMVCVTGALLLGYGIYLQGNGNGVLMIIFGILGLSNLKDVLKTIKNPPTKADWLMEHVRGMIITGIAAYTAFFAFGGRTLMGNIFTGYWMIIPWVAPTVLGIRAIKYLEKYYQRKRKPVIATA
ncbi:MAG: hypothetical protein AAF960_13530 [Bacteroidota bacterium]